MIDIMVDAFLNAPDNNQLDKVMDHVLFRIEAAGMAPPKIQTVVDYVDKFGPWKYIDSSAMWEEETPES